DSGADNFYFLTSTSYFLAELRLFEVNCFRRHATETTRQTELRQSPDQPFGRVPLPRLYAVAVIVLKFVMIIVIALAEREHRHQQRIARAAFCRIGLAPDRVAGGVNMARSMLQHGHFRPNANEK